MINLTKGEKVSLAKGMKAARIGLGWDIKGDKTYDLDASIFALNSNGKLAKDTDFVFYNNLKHPSGAIIHTGDNRTGAGDGDDESIYIDFDKLPNEIAKLAVVITIHPGNDGENFGQVENAFVRLLSVKDQNDAGSEELRFDLSEDYSTATGILVAEIYRKDGEWKFAAKGEGSKNNLESFVKSYGGSV